MFWNKKAQSTAEYAIVIGLVVAVAAGIMQVALKGGMREKQNQALNYLRNQGSGTLSGTDFQEDLYNQEYRKTTVSGGTNFADATTMMKGGLEKKRQLQTTQTDTTSVELLDKIGAATVK